MNELMEWLFSLEFFGIKLGLEQTRELFSRIGNPEKELRFIHIAGSNGKGSTAAMIESALRSAGFRTGFYSSPHLVSVNERFMINGVPASDASVEKALALVKEASDSMKQENKFVTFFEATTAIAAEIFRSEKVDFVVWEVGMGGRLDATNIVTPELSVITGISLEHKEYLGDTIEKIASEKAGIIKPDTPVFIGPATPPAAISVFRKKATEMNAEIIIAPDVGKAKRIYFDDVAKMPHQELEMADGRLLKVSLPGAHQRWNASLAYEVVKRLSAMHSFPLDKAAEGFSCTVWPARLQFVPELRLIIDGAHNPEGAQVLYSSLTELFPGRKFDFIYGTFADKDCTAFLSTIVPLAKSFAFVKIHSPRPSREASELEKIILENSPSGHSIQCRASDLSSELEKRRREVRENPSGTNWKILCGSLYLCGEALGILHS